MHTYIVIHIYVIEGSLEVKLPTIWTNGKAEVGRVREDMRREQKRKQENRNRKKQRRKKKEQKTKNKEERTKNKEERK